VSPEDLDISYTTRSLPKYLGSLPLVEIKRAVLGKRYELSLVFIGSTLSRRLNSAHRGKDKSANVLSFPLTKNTGEMFIDIQQSQKEAPKFGKTHSQFVAYLFIHGLLHLKGMPHGDTMEKAEIKFLKKFNL
jgi:probable rRNA maturation factor